MSMETGTNVLAVVPLVAAVGALVAVRKRSLGGAVFSLVVGFVTLLVFLNLGRDLEEQRRRDSIRKTKRRHVEGVFADRNGSPHDRDRIGESSELPPSNSETHGSPHSNHASVASMGRAKSSGGVAASGFGSVNGGMAGTLGGGRTVPSGRRSLPIAPLPANPATAEEPR